MTRSVSGQPIGRITSGAGNWVDPANVDAECKRWLEHLQLDSAPAASSRGRQAGRKEEAG